MYEASYCTGVVTLCIEDNAVLKYATLIFNINIVIFN